MAPTSNILKSTTASTTMTATANPTSFVSSSTTPRFSLPDDPIWNPMVILALVYVLLFTFLGIGALALFVYRRHCARARQAQASDSTEMGHAAPTRDPGCKDTDTVASEEEGEKDDSVAYSEGPQTPFKMPTRSWSGSTIATGGGSPLDREKEKAGCSSPVIVLLPTIPAKEIEAMEEQAKHRGL